MSFAHFSVAEMISASKVNWKKYKVKYRADEDAELKQNSEQTGLIF